jgi:hypothetical protein
MIDEDGNGMLSYDECVTLCKNSLSVCVPKEEIGEDNEFIE